MKNNFQIAISGIFIAFVVFAVLIFSGVISIGNSTSTDITGNVIIWGTLDANAVNTMMDSVGDSSRTFTIRYIQKDPTTFHTDYVEALAQGKGPDMILVPGSFLSKEKATLVAIPYASYPQKTFTDTFVGAGGVYLDAKGVLGIPLVVDPLVLYYNKDILANHGIALPPATWTDVLNETPDLTIRDKVTTIKKSAIALGQFDNILNAKAIIALLFLQSGNTIVTTDESGKLYSNLSNNGTILNATPESVMTFYTDFSNPLKNAYSWNKAMPLSRDAFISGDVVFYIGYGSELFKIKEKNPNLNFDVSQIPQIVNTPRKTTYGNVYGLSMVSASKNMAAASATLGLLGDPVAVKALAVVLSLPPARRDSLSEKQNNPYVTTFYNSALITQSFADPDTEGTTKIFKDMVDNITSGKLDVSSAIGNADNQLKKLLR